MEQDGVLSDAIGQGVLEDTGRALLQRSSEGEGQVVGVDGNRYGGSGERIKFERHLQADRLLAVDVGDVEDRRIDSGAGIAELDGHVLHFKGQNVRTEAVWIRAYDALYAIRDTAGAVDHGDAAG